MCVYEHTYIYTCVCITVGSICKTKLQIAILACVTLVKDSLSSRMNAAAKKAVLELSNH